jgi:hypothetical protein
MKQYEVRASVLWMVRSLRDSGAYFFTNMPLSRFPALRT